MRSLAPTMTLAQLFESQNQLFDALAVYSRLLTERSDPEIRARFEAVQGRILGDDKLHYDPRLTRLFDDEERKRLKILPQDRYEKLQESMQQQEDEQEDLNIEADDELAPEPRKTYLEGSYEEESPVSKAVPSGEWLDMTVGEVARLASKLLGEDTPLRDVTLGELIRVFYGTKE